MQTNELREKYLAFFQSKGHRRCASDVLVPTWDPSVLFTPAGMNQFKDHFLGKVKLDFTTATTCQKCLRTGDIDNVGRTAYHHTFFEMLGNFSFGDYFKREAIHWAWEFLTDKQWLGIDPERLSVTVYKDDDEAAEIWRQEIGLPDSRIQRLDEDENFWPASAPSQGPDGVCGPCSEIYYHPPSGKEVEIWNLVFTQFNRVGDPPDNLRPLPSRNIDTGMGLERTAATLQGVETNFHIDILFPIVEAAAEVCGVKYSYDSDHGRRLRRITDHVRACTMAVHENVYPGPNKEKYVIKRLLRRAVLDGHQMGLREPFLCKIVPAVVEQMKVPYPDLVETTERVASVIEKEEANFFGTIDAGLARIGKIFDTMRTDNRLTVDGGEAADLYQTNGVPPELFEAMAAEEGLAFDWGGFHHAMEEHGQASGKLAHGVMGDFGPRDSIKKVVKETEFLGYECVTAEAEVKGIIAADQLRDEQQASDADVIVVLDRSPFYGESGGQVGDVGTLASDDVTVEVTDTQKDGDLLLHHGKIVKGTLRVGQTIQGHVDEQRRQAIQRAHSATHILHYALQKHLGSHAQQQGSKVDGDWLRFDFTNLAPVDAEHLVAIEYDVNQQVAAAAPIQWQNLPLADAREQGAMMLFGEKYPDPVRMVSMGDFSKELCGGTHLANTSEVGAFDIISEEGVSAGTRRVVALTGDKATENVTQTREVLQRTADLLEVSQSAVPEAVKQLTQRVRDLKKQLASGGKGGQATAASNDIAAGSDGDDYPTVKATLRTAARALNVAPFDVAERVQAMLADAESLSEQISQVADSGELSADTLLEKAEQVAGAAVIIAETPGANPNIIRQLIDQIRQKVSPVAVLLAAPQGDSKVIVVAGLSRDLVENGASAGKWVGEVAKVMGGGGGGKPDMAQAGGKQPEKLADALQVALQTIQEQITA